MSLNQSVIASEIFIKYSFLVERSASPDYDFGDSNDSIQTTSSIEVPMVAVDDEPFEETQEPIKIYSRGKQEEVEKSLKHLELEIEVITARHESFALDDIGKEELKQKRAKKTELKKKLKRLEANRVSSAHHRMKIKERLGALSTQSEGTSSSKPGRPKLIDSQPDLLDLAEDGCAAHNRRRTDDIRTLKTLNDLHKALEERGFQISRSSVFTHRSINGKRHIDTVPVRLLRATNDYRKAHEDAFFAKASIDHTMEMASFLGPAFVGILSQDDKARVPLGITAANKQQQILMHMQYAVKLPDHDFVVWLRCLTPKFG